MRADMAKVIVERPCFDSRMHGKPKGYRRSFRRVAEGGGPARRELRQYPIPERWWQ